MTDEDLVSLLALVDPAGIIVERWDFDQEMNWALTLSGGQKQRVAVRLAYPPAASSRSLRQGSAPVRAHRLASYGIDDRINSSDTSSLNGK